jgi:hypothetical protein
MISIVTITKNRRHFLPLAIENFNRINNIDIEWIILDDSYECNEKYIPQKDNIHYIFLNKDKIKFFLKKAYSITNKNKSWKLWYDYHVKTHTLPIGMKRNIANFYTKGSIIVHFDDDDFYSESSLNERVENLKNYDCVYCNKITCFDIKLNKYFIKGGINDISEATMAYYKSVWEKNKFNNLLIEQEGQEFIRNLKTNILHSDNIIISLYHSDNTSINNSINYFLPKIILEENEINKIRTYKDNSFCSQSQDLWILRDLFNYSKNKSYISIFPIENYCKLLDEYNWKGLYFGNNENENNFINKKLNNFIDILNTQKFPKHINFLNLSRRFDILYKLYHHKYSFDIVIINYENNKNLSLNCNKILLDHNMIKVKHLEYEDCYININFIKDNLKSPMAFL